MMRYDSRVGDIESRAFDSAKVVGRPLVASGGMSEASVSLYRKRPGNPDLLESRHEVHVAVVDQDGRLVASAGDPARLTVLHSVAKPWQARVCLGASSSIDERLLAIICGSHCGADAHASQILRGLSTGGLQPDALAVGLGYAGAIGFDTNAPVITWGSYWPA